MGENITYHMADTGEAEILAHDAMLNDMKLVVGALVVNRDGKIFAQRRSLSRRLFPGGWDIPGGHVEGHENLAETLLREIREETGWVIEDIRLLLATRDWENGEDQSREFIFLVTVMGDLGAPQLESEKVDACDWFGPTETDRLNENRPITDHSLQQIFDHAFRALEHLDRKTKNPNAL